MRAAAYADSVDCMRYAEALQERLWTRVPEYRRPAPLTWLLDQDWLSGIRILWPTAYQWAPRVKWGRQIADALSRHVLVEHVPVPQPYKHCIVAEVQIFGRTHHVVFETSDYLPANPNALAGADLVFKLQYRTGGYGTEKIVPGGYLPSDGRLLLPYLRRLRRLRATPKRHGVHARFSLAFAEGERRTALDALTGSGLPVTGGGDRKVRYGRFLREVSRSAVAVDLPGNGPLCFRLVDYLAVGACIVALPHGVEMHVPLQDGEHIAYAKDGNGGLVELCEHYLSKPACAESMRRAASNYYDRFLHPAQLGAYYLSTIRDRLTSGPWSR